MKIIIKSTDLDLTPSLKNYINTKIGVLEKFIGRFDQEGAVELKIEVARTTRHHHKGDVFMAEVNLFLPKKVLRAVERSEDIRKSIDSVKKKLLLEIEKYKSQHGSTHKA